MNSRFCSACGENKTEDKFPSRSTKCRSCCDAIWEANMRSQGLDPDQIRRDKKNARRARQRQGVSLQKVKCTKPDDYFAEVNEKQGGVCAICLQADRDTHLGVVKKLCRDHNHETGEWRGLLCTRCNTAIGLLDDDIATVLRAATYLQQHEPITTPLEQPSTALPATPAPI